MEVSGISPPPVTPLHHDPSPRVMPTRMVDTHVLEGSATTVTSNILSLRLRARTNSLLDTLVLSYMVDRCVGLYFSGYKSLGRDQRCIIKPQE